MEKNSTPIPIPAENSMANQENRLNSGEESSAPSRIRPNRLHARNRHVNSVAQTVRT